MKELDRDGWISGSRCLAAGLSEKDVDVARALLKAAARYFAKGISAESARTVEHALRLACAQTDGLVRRDANGLG